MLIIRPFWGRSFREEAVWEGLLSSGQVTCVGAESVERERRQLRQNVWPHEGRISGKCVERSKTWEQSLQEGMSIYCLAAGV